MSAWNCSIHTIISSIKLWLDRFFHPEQRVMNILWLTFSRDTCGLWIVVCIISKLDIDNNFSRLCDLWMCVIWCKEDFYSRKTKYLGHTFIVRRGFHRIPICTTRCVQVSRPINLRLRNRIDDHSIFKAIYLHFDRQIHHVRTLW